MRRVAHFCQHFYLVVSILVQANHNYCQEQLGCLSKLEVDIKIGENTSFKESGQGENVIISEEIIECLLDSEGTESAHVVNEKSSSQNGEAEKLNPRLSGVLQIIESLKVSLMLCNTINYKIDN